MTLAGVEWSAVTSDRKVEEVGKSLFPAMANDDDYVFLPYRLLLLLLLFLFLFFFFTKNPVQKYLADISLTYIFFSDNYSWLHKCLHKQAYMSFFNS